MALVQQQRAIDFLTFMDDHNYEALENLMSDNFAHRFHPASLGGLGMPSRNKQQLLDLLVDLEATYEHFGFQPPKEIVKSQDVVVIHTTSDGRTTSGKSFNNEYILIIHFQGEKITSVKEFMDSKYVTETLERESTAISIGKAI